MEDAYKKIWDKARSARHILLISHKNPDGDTLGAMLAFGAALDAYGLTHTRFCSDEVSSAYYFMSGNHRITSDSHKVWDARPDLVVSFDAGDLVFAGAEEVVSRIHPKPFIINIDHHHTNTRFGNLNAVVTDAASTTEVVHRIMLANKIAIDMRMATCILTGLCTDTGNFSNPATTSSALHLGGELLAQGAKFGSIYRSLWKNKSLSGLRLWGAALERLRYNPENQTATTALFLKDLADSGSDEEAAEGISNFLSSVLDVPVVLVLREAEGGKIKGSYRTTGDMDVSALAAVWGGGGHKKAAGFIIEGKIEETKNEWKIVKN